MALAASFVLPLHRSGVNWRAAACLAAADLSSPPIMLANAGTSRLVRGKWRKARGAQAAAL